MARRKPYLPSVAVLRFLDMLHGVAKRYRWTIELRRRAIRGYAAPLQNGRCIIPDENCYCPLTACYPAGDMAHAKEYGKFFGLTGQEALAIIYAADNYVDNYTTNHLRYNSIAVLRPLLLAAVGLPPEKK